jgi:hypothetical protein
METNQATTAEGELALHLYDLRRETEMRKARNWFAGEFWPRSFSDIGQTMEQFDSQQSRWLRQVISYWETAAALVLHGAINPALFHDTCGEAWFCYAKLKPFAQEGRTKFSPEFLVKLEKVVEATAEGRERLQFMQEMLAHFRAMAEERKKQQTPAHQAA